MASRKKQTRSLARPGDPLVTERGITILPDRRIENDEPEIEEGIRPESFKPTAQRVLKDMPAPVRVLKGVACVMFFSVLGIGDREICDALGITIGDLKQIRNHSSYGECFDMLGAEFINANSESLAARLAAYSQSALTNVHDIAKFGKKEETKLRANIDLLDRAGAGAKEMNARRGSTGKDLRIIVVDGETEVDVAVRPTAA